MLEMPSVSWTGIMYKELENIYVKHGITPIIAHIDRYIGPFRTHGILKQLEQLPVLIQANGNFFLRPATASMALRMLKKNQIHLLGSDCHDRTVRTPNLGKVLQKIESSLGESALQQIQAFENAVLL